MGWRQDAERVLGEIRQDGLEEAAEDLESNYVLDQRELGKIILISSVAMALAAIPSAMALQEAREDVNSVNSGLASLQGIAGSSDFQERVRTLQRRVGGGLGRTLGTAYNTIQTANESISALESTESELEKRAQTYRWLSLISIVGIVAGATTMYV